MISLLARANVALSVVLTLMSTLLSFFFTPLWCKRGGAVRSGGRVERVCHRCRWWWLR